MAQTASPTDSDAYNKAIVASLAKAAVAPPQAAPVAALAPAAPAPPAAPAVAAAAPVAAV